MTALPLDLAPALREQVERLLAEVGGEAMHREHKYDGPAFTGNRCFVCRRGGRMGGHHLEDGTVVLVHAKCHRRIHLRG